MSLSSVSDSEDVSDLKILETIITNFRKFCAIPCFLAHKYPARGFFYSGFFRNLRCAHQIYIPFGEKIIVLKFELTRISIMPGKITLNFYLRGLLYKGGPKN